MKISKRKQSSIILCLLVKIQRKMIKNTAIARNNPGLLLIILCETTTMKKQ